MEAKQIKEQMSSTPWKKKGEDRQVVGHGEVAVNIRITDTDGYIPGVDALVATVYDCWNLNKQHANTHAIVSAVNNTFGRDINPAQVPELYRMLDHVKRYLVGDILREVNELLAAAKFTNELSE